MSDRRRTEDGGRRIRACAVFVASASLALLLVAAVLRLWAGRIRVVVGERYEGVVFDQVRAGQIPGSMLVVDAGGFWTPTDKDIRDLEYALAAAAQAGHPVGLRPLDEFHRQYFGYSLHGERRILIIGFCDPKSLEWTKTFVSAGEGGCHFEAGYDVAKAVISNF